MKKRPSGGRKKKDGEGRHDEVAELLCYSYFVLVVIGENFSSSSGFQVLEEVVSNSVYKEKYSIANLKQALVPSILEKNEELFYGIWGRVLNKYQSIRPNNGYSVIMQWRTQLFSESDIRFLEQKGKAMIAKNARLFKDKEGQDIEQEETKPKGPKRFYLVTSCIDAEAFKTGFPENDVFETKGNILTWQCSVPCCKEVWQSDPEFRFEVSRETGQAPPIKYCDTKRTPVDEKLRIFLKDRMINRKSEKFNTGDEEDFNFADPFGITEYEGRNGGNNTHNKKEKSVITSSENLSKLGLSRKMTEKRTMYYRYFVPNVAQQLRDPKHYFLPGNKQFFKSVHYGSSVLRPLNPSGELINESGEKTEGIVRRHEIILETWESESESSPSDGDSNFGKSLSTSTVTGFDISEHEFLHQLAFEGQIDSMEQGIVDIVVIDPMIYHHEYYTNLSDNENLSQISGSDSEFFISLLIANPVKNEIPVKYFFHTVKPAIRKHRARNGTYADTLIVDVKKYHPEKTYNIMPRYGKISLVVDPIISKQRFSKANGNAGHVCNLNEKPWQLYGEYSIKSLKEGNHHSSMKNEGKMVDFVVIGKNSDHELKIRTIQHENMKHEIVSIFIALPISNFKTKSRTLSETTVSHGIKNLPPAQIQDSTGIELENQKRDDIFEEENDKVLKKPVVNRIICPYCHGKSRPRIKMLDDKKWIKTLPTKYKAWLKIVSKEIKDDPNKTVVILELGAEPSLRKVSEMLLKQTSMFGTKLVRVNPKNVQLKKGAAPTREDENIILVENEDCISFLQKVDDYVKIIAPKTGLQYI